MRANRIKLKKEILMLESMKIVDKIKKWLMSKFDVKYFNLEIDLN